MAPEFGLSKYGRRIVIAEDPPSAIRKFSIAIIILVGIFAILNAIRVFLQLRRKHALPFLVKLTFAVFILNLLVHTAHYADNVWRPVAYYEPKYLYDKYIFETMEITTIINFPIMVLGAMGIGGIFKFRKGQLIISKSGCYFLIGFIVGSLLTVLHYRIEPPSSYSIEVNFTIAGEGVVAILLLILVLICLRMAGKEDMKLEERETVEMENLLEDQQEYLKGSATRRSPRQKR